MERWKRNAVLAFGKFDAAQRAESPEWLAVREQVNQAQLGRALWVAEQLLPAGQDQRFLRAKIATAQFYAEHVLVKVSALRDAVVHGADSVMALGIDDF